MIFLILFNSYYTEAANVLSEKYVDLLLLQFHNCQIMKIGDRKHFSDSQYIISLEDDEKEIDVPDIHAGSIISPALHRSSGKTSTGVSR